MNKPVYRAAILPTFLHSCPNPKFNPKTKPLTLTLLLQTPHTLNYRRAARHPNRLRSPFCTKTRSNTAHQQVHNKSYKWSVGFNVNDRTVIAVRPTYRMTYIHHIAALTAHMYARRQAALQFPRMCIIHCRPRDGRVGSAPPPPRQPVSLVLSRHGRTDIMAMKDALGRMERRRPDARPTVDTCARTGWPRHSASPPTPRAAAVISERR